MIAVFKYSLANLPDGPELSLKAEMLASKSDSRVPQRRHSLTPVHRNSNHCRRAAATGRDQLDAVDGHRAGEVTSSYVSGFLFAMDAIRGASDNVKYTPLANAGVMVVAGTDMQDAMELYTLPKLKGRAQLEAYPTHSK